jgi:hypothetical protein
MSYPKKKKKQGPQMTDQQYNKKTLKQTETTTLKQSTANINLFVFHCFNFLDFSERRERVYVREIKRKKEKGEYRTSGLRRGKRRSQWRAKWCTATDMVKLPNCRVGFLVLPCWVFLVLPCRVF